MKSASDKPSVLLVADRTLSARYRVLFEGMFATMQTTAVPEWLVRSLLAPAMPTDSAGRAWAAPLGLRRLEAALLADTPLTPDDVAVTTPEALPSLLGPHTRVVGFSSSDPLGSGMSNTTTSCFWSGELYTKVWTDRLLAQLRDARTRHPFHVIAGGAGAWQWLDQPDEAQRQGLDVILDGYAERLGPETILSLLDRPADVAPQGPPTVVRETGCAADYIRPIRDASLLGIIELSRGCGRGCRFCTMAAKPMHHLHPDIILDDLETNVAAGITSVVSGSEDFFRYGSDGPRPRINHLVALLEEMRQFPDLAFMQIDHANITSVAQLSLDELTTIRRLLTWRRPGRLWVNLGVESANGHLVAATSTGKIRPFRPDDWEDLVRDSIVKLQQAGYTPVVSLILGLPGETPDDVSRTHNLVRWLDERNTIVFPIFYEPVTTRQRREGLRFDLSRLRLDHLDLYRHCYEINFRTVPPLFWDNQRAGGVILPKRILMRLLGFGEIRTWRRRFHALRNELERTAPVARASCPRSFTPDATTPTAPQKPAPTHSPKVTSAHD